MTAAPRFSPGDPVSIAARSVPGHCRTPAYLRGAPGRVHALLGAFRNPEDLAYGGAGLPKIPLYWIEVAMTDLWPGYRGDETDTLLVEIYEHWLRPQEGEGGHAP